jgi:uncharacterized DUF497 family protein
MAKCYTTVMQELHFTWHEEKNKRNKKLHGIAFEDAKFVFRDPNKLVIPDITHGEDDEARWDVIGLVDKLLFVVYAEEGNNIQLISARIATKAEQEAYNVSNINA